MDGDTDDVRLVRAAQGGDKSAFALLLTRRRTLLVSLCRRVLGDDDAAQDVAQEASLQAYLSLDRLRRAEQFGPWLCGIGLNLCRHRLRRQRDMSSWDALYGGRHDPTRDIPDKGIGPDERAELIDLRGRVQRAVADLPRGQRAILDANGVTWQRHTTQDEHGREDVEETGYGPDGQQTYHIRRRTIRDESGRDVIENTSLDASGKEINRMLFDPITKAPVDVATPEELQATVDVL